ncbi:DMT family transporter [Effusibacillus dendaii]|uniref:Transporter n=1 Tax=Effusibacillus dendaii TaxID=2743772 RepID=A0A7I8DEE9_9BACL|nr:DMT family transporter [Effusibacillus dendaii]BCJ88523.1 transporter [Effusibacillus dendaii]
MLLLNRKTLLADLTLLLVTFIWGATFVLVQDATESMPPFSFLAVRFAVAAVLLYLILLIWKPDQLRFRKKIWSAGAIAGFWLFAGYAFQTFGLQYTTASKAGFITGLSVILVPLLAIWMLRMMPTRWTIAGAGMASVGLAMLSLNRVEAANFGDLLVFFGAFSYAMQILLVGKYAPLFPALPFVLVQIIVITILNALGAVLFEPWQSALRPHVLLNSTVIAAIIICALFATVFAYVTQAVVQKFTTATRTALIFSMEPVFAALAGYLWADERLTLQAVVGCLLILVGMILAELGGSQEKTERMPDTRPVP